MRLLPYGDRALLVELGDTAAVLGLVEALTRADLASVGELVPAAATVLVVAADGVPLARLRADLQGVLDAPAQAAPAPAPADAVETAVEIAVEIAVRYDGADLAEVARLTGLAEDEVVRAHTGRAWRVAFGGFAPGFAYLAGGDPRLRVPRRDRPRTHVPAGAVGLADEYSGVYPRASPGGWQLIGTATARMWDLERVPPALLRPGALVRFVAR